MKFKLLRFSLLSMLMLLCGGLSVAGILKLQDDGQTETLTPSTTSGYAELTVTNAGTSGTGSALEISKGDIVVTSDKGYIKDHEMTVYKTGSMTIGFKEGVNAHITKVELTVKNYHFQKPEGWTAEYSNDTDAKINTDETEVFTTDATNKTSLTVSNASSGKTTVKVITVHYVIDSETPGGGGDEPGGGGETGGDEEGIANPYAYTFASKVFTTKSETQKLANVNWTLDMTAEGDSYFGYDSTKGQQFGKAADPATALTLSTSDIEGTITKVKVNTSGATDIDATLTVTVGSNTFTASEAESVSLTKDATDYEFTGSSTGAITLSYANNSAKAIYLKSIEVEYTVPEEPVGFRDIKLNLMEHSELLTGGDVYITVAEDGTIGTTDNAENAAATIKGNAHGSYGSSNFTASVPVEGCVKITYATHDYGNDIVVTNSAGAEVAKLNTMGDKWMNNHDNVAVAYYRTNEPTTLYFSKANYNPYFAVEAIDPADLPAEVTVYNVTFAAGEGTGVAPAALEVEAGGKFTAPKNYTLYAEGKTLTGWSDGTTTYNAGAEITPEADMALTAVFTTNEAALADRTEAVTIAFTLNGNAGQHKFEGNTGFMVTQATVNGKTIDVKADINATSGKFAYNGSGWHQVNAGTTIAVPSCKGATIAVSTYNDGTGASMTFAGNAGTANNNVVSYTATADDASCEIAQVSNNYWNSLEITLPVVSEEPVGFRDIKLNLMEHSELLTGGDVYITVAEDGTIGTTDNAENAAATIKGNVHGSYGSSNFTASVPVEGCVKITYATHDYGNDIVVTNSAGAEVAKLNTTGDKWMNNHDNVAVAYYRTNEPTTLYFSKANYNPYFAVEAIDPADLPAEVTVYNVTFAAGEGTGVAPAALEVEAGGKFTAPKNYTLYAEGKTLTGWSDGTTTYNAGAEITPEADMALTAVFTTNEAALADRTEAVTIAFTLNGNAGQHKFEGNTGFMVTQATVNGKTIDVKADINATSGKFAYNGSGWHQVNAGTTIAVPSCKGATIAVSTYNDGTGASMTFAGNAGTANNNVVSYTATAEDASCEIAQVSNNYWNSLEITLPVVSEEVSQLYITGNHTSNGWSTDNPDKMTYNAETQKYEYELNFPETEYFTIATGKTDTANDWETFGTYRLGIGAGDQTIADGTEYQLANYSDGTMVIQGGGKYKVSVTPDLKMVVTLTGPYEEPEASYVVAGWLKETEDAGFFGTAWAPSLEANKMEKQDDGTYKKEWSNVELPAGTIEYKIVKNGDTWIPEGDNLTCTIAEAGTYVITVTFNAETNEANMTAGEDPQPPTPVNNDLLWEYDAEHPIPTAGPDNGLYYGAYVNDAAGTNNGMHGVKLNSSGWAYFEKAPVAGKLTLTFGNRKNADAYAVNVYKGTLDENKKGVKGDLIGEIAISESPGSGSIELDADVTGVYIERKTSSEGVLSKIVFKETKPRTFVDFEITNEQMSGEFDASTLPDGVLFSGTQRNDNHGYGNVTIVVPVDGTVKFTIGGCQYANPANCKVTNAAGETLATPNLKTTKCYHQDGTVVTYFYVGEPTTLTFSDIAYLPYFKAEATEVSEVTITYKDQNGNVLGKKTVYEGDPIGEIPYTEADLNIGDGVKFRGWIYTSGIKVKTTDIVSANITVSALVTPIEHSPEVGTVQTYDLTKATFYPEDHENFNVEGGYYHDGQHGWAFGNGEKFEVAVGGKAQIVLTLCQYSKANATFTVKDVQNNVVADDVPGIAETDGATTIVNYDGPASMLSFTYNTEGESYLHSVKVYNVSDFVEKDETSDYYIIPAGDGAGLIMAINQASSEENSKIFLPNGTYDLGETVLTGISGKNVSIIGESMEGVIIKNAPDVSLEGLGSADLLVNTGEGLYLQDLTLQNALDFYAAGSAGRAVTLHDKGTKTINKNVRHLSYQDTYYSHKTGGLFYFEGGEIHGTVDYMCGYGRVYFNKVTLVNEQRNTATMTANSELYVFNECVVENNADVYNFGRAWSNHPTCIFLNTTLKDPDKLATTRWNLTGINCDYSIAGEYGTMNAQGENITPAANNVTFTKENTSMNTILDASALETYSIQNVLGEWAETAQDQAKQVTAPTAELKDGTISWEPVAGATAYALFKDGEFIGITTETSFVVETGDAASSRAQDTAVYTIRAANERGGFGEPTLVTVADGIQKLNVENIEGLVIYDLQGRRVNTVTSGIYIINGKKTLIK